MNPDETATRSALTTRPAREHAEFVGSIPEHYDQCLGPFLFHHYARDLARRVRVPASGTVLEIACGTGISTRHLREALPDSVTIVATDLNEAMLDHACRACADLENVRFEQADAQDLPFADDSFDAVTCQFGLMFLPDRVQGLREIRRVLRPGGAFAGNTWMSMTDNPVIATMRDTLAGFLGGEAPSFFEVPFGYHDEDRIAADLTSAGFGDLTFETVRTQGESATAQRLATGFVEGTPGIQEIRARATAGTDEIVAAIAREIGALFGDAPLRGPLAALVVAARRPLS